MFFFNVVGYELRFVAEGFYGRNHGGNQGGPPDDKRGNQHKDKRNGEGDGPNRFNPNNSEGKDRYSENQETSQGDSLEDDIEELIRDDSPREEEEDPKDRYKLIEAYHPELGSVPCDQEENFEGLLDNSLLHDSSTILEGLAYQETVEGSSQISVVNSQEAM